MRTREGRAAAATQAECEALNTQLANRKARREKQSIDRLSREVDELRAQLTALASIVERLQAPKSKTKTGSQE